MRRGDVRSAIIDVLAAADQPINGYQVIQQIAERTDGAWKPSPGSVYPTIAQLQDEGLVEDAPTGRKAIQLTDEGRTYVEEHPEEMAAVWAPFAEQADDDEAVNFKQVIGQTVGAIVQVATTGTPDQREKAIEILGDTRRRLYGLLAEGPDDHRGRVTRGGVMDSLRISDADRQAAVDLLGEQYAVGRLTRDEFDERSDAVWSAKTQGDLAPVFADLPVQLRRPGGRRVGHPHGCRRGRPIARAGGRCRCSGAVRAGRADGADAPAVRAALRGAVRSASARWRAPCAVGGIARG